jgi:ATP-dependent 26S proteasome regulatory subunit
MNLTRGIDLKKIAEKMNGCSGAELKGVCTEAGMYALRERRIHVMQEDFGKTSSIHTWLVAYIGRPCYCKGTQQARR